MENEIILFYLLNRYFSKSDKNIEIENINESDELIIDEIVQKINNKISLLIPNILSAEITKAAKIEEKKRCILFNKIIKSIFLDSASLISEVNEELEKYKTDFSDLYDNYRKDLDKMWINYLNTNKNLPYPFVRLKELLIEKYKES